MPSAPGRIKIFFFGWRCKTHEHNKLPMRDRNARRREHMRDNPISLKYRFDRVNDWPDAPSDSKQERQSILSHWMEWAVDAHVRRINVRCVKKVNINISKSKMIIVIIFPKRNWNSSKMWEMRSSVKTERWNVSIRCWMLDAAASHRIFYWQCDGKGIEVMMQPGRHISNCSPGFIWKKW